MSSNGEDNNYGTDDSTYDDSVHYSDEEENFMQRRTLSEPPTHPRPLSVISNKHEDNDHSPLELPIGHAGSWGQNGSWMNLPIAKLDAQKFCSRLDMYMDSVKVTVLVGPELVAFKAPKDMLCHHSKFFDRALNGKWKESLENQITLEEDKPSAFELIVQWMFTGNIICPWDLDASGHVGSILDFLKLADKIDLTGSLVAVIATLKSTLLAARSLLPNRNSCQHTWDVSGPCQGHHNSNAGGWQNGSSLTYCVDDSITDPDPLRDNVIKSQHLRTAFDLPSGHDARAMLVDACVASYVLKGGLQGNWGPVSTFRFQRELDTIDGFAVELLQAVQKSIRITPIQGGHTAVIIDPLTGKHLNL